MNIAVLRGGPAREYEQSLSTGALVRDVLSGRHNVTDIFIDKGGLWHKAGIPTSAEEVFRHTDLVYNALHGEYGEDGTVQQLMESFHVPYTGPTPFAAASAWRKDMSRKILIDAGLRVPAGFTVRVEDDFEDTLVRAFRELGAQYVLKPVVGSGSEGVRILKTPFDLEYALAGARLAYGTLELQEAIHGREFKVIVVEGFRGQNYYTSFPIEIDKGTKLGVYYPNDENVRYHVPARLIASEKNELTELAIQVHKILGLKDYSSCDFILKSSGEMYVLEVDTLPPLAQNNYFDQALKATGASLTEFINHVVDPTGVEPVTSALQMRRSTR